MYILLVPYSYYYYYYYYHHHHHHHHHHLWNTRPKIQTQRKTGSTILKEWTTPNFRNTLSTTNLEEEEIVDALGNDGNASMPEQVNRPNPWKKIIIFFYSFGELTVRQGLHFSAQTKSFPPLLQPTWNC
jgi:hypothetical protein